MALMQFENVSYINDGKEIIKDISLEIDEGDFVSIVGHSGCGKSTFLKLCCHLISPSAGHIVLQEKDILEVDPVALRKEIVYCFQTPSLFGRTVLDNLKFPYLIRNIAYDEPRVKELFLKFKLNMDLIHQKVGKLSGGEKQRIALIRALLFRPKMILLDEITSALDADNTHVVEEAIESFHADGMTILWVTHHPEQSRKFANKVLTLEHGKLKALEMIK